MRGCRGAGHSKRVARSRPRSNREHPINLCQPGESHLETQTPRQWTGRAQERGGPACWEGQSGKGPSVCVGGGAWGSVSPPGRQGLLLSWQDRIGGQASPGRRAQGGQGRGAAQQVREIAQARRGFVNRSLCLYTKKNSSAGSVVKNPPADAGHTRDTGSIPGLGRSPGGGNDSPLQCSCLERPMDEPGG